MQALRSVQKIPTEQVTISVIRELQNRRIEIILLPIDEPANDFSFQTTTKEKEK